MRVIKYLSTHVVLVIHAHFSFYRAYLFLQQRRQKEYGEQNEVKRSLYDLLKFHCFHFLQLIFPVQLHCCVSHTPPRERSFLPFYSTNWSGYRVCGQWHKSTFPQTCVAIKSKYEKKRKKRRKRQKRTLVKNFKCLTYDIHKWVMYVTVSCNPQKNPTCTALVLFSSKGKIYNQVTCTYRPKQKPRETGNKEGAVLKMENLYQSEAAQSCSVNSDDLETI